MASTAPWQCPGCLVWNWASRPACRACCEPRILEGAKKYIYYDGMWDDYIELFAEFMSYSEFLEEHCCIAAPAVDMPTVECFDITEGDDKDDEDEFFPSADNIASIPMVPDAGWDPLDLTANGDMENFQGTRPMELKHGKVPIAHGLAVISEELVHVVDNSGVREPEGSWDLAGFTADDNAERYQRKHQKELPHGLATLSAEQVHVEDNLGVQDLVGYWDPAGFMAKDNVERIWRRHQKELEHGGVSMLDTMDCCITPERAGYLSPFLGIKLVNVPHGLAAISEETVHAKDNLGVQDPEGFWNPAGFKADGNIERFKRRRQELKHGEVSMLTALGCITPERGNKLLGYLFPFMGIKCADGILEVKATAGDTRLGGKDVDDRVVEFSMQDFKRKSRGKDLPGNQHAIQLSTVVWSNGSVGDSMCRAA